MAHQSPSVVPSRWLLLLVCCLMWSVVVLVVLVVVVLMQSSVSSTSPWTRGPVTVVATSRRQRGARDERSGHLPNEEAGCMLGWMYELAVQCELRVIGCWLHLFLSMPQWAGGLSLKGKAEEKLVCMPGRIIKWNLGVVHISATLIVVYLIPGDVTWYPIEGETQPVTLLVFSCLLMAEDKGNTLCNVLSLFLSLPLFLSISCSDHLIPIPILILMSLVYVSRLSGWYKWCHLQ